MSLEECAPGARHVPPSEMMLPSSSVLKRLSCVCVCVCVCACVCVTVQTTAAARVRIHMAAAAGERGRAHRPDSVDRCDDL